MLSLVYACLHFDVYEESPREPEHQIIQVQVTVLFLTT